MTDLAQGQAASAGIAIPSPLSIRPRAQSATADSGRAMARAVLDDALSGVELTAVDRRFLSRLSQWDKRNATTVASLIARARQAGSCSGPDRRAAGDSPLRADRRVRVPDVWCRLGRLLGLREPGQRAVR